MPRLYQRTAKKDIYLHGNVMDSILKKQGFSRDRSIPGSPDIIGEEDTLLIKKGQQYYTWHPKGSDWQYSLTKPDLRSAWEIEMDDFQQRVSEFEGIDEDDEDYDETSKDDLRTEIEERKDELQESLERMPDHLQEGHMLNERIEELESLLNEL